MTSFINGEPIPTKEAESLSRISLLRSKEILRNLKEKSYQIKPIEDQKYALIANSKVQIK